MTSLAPRAALLALACLLAASGCAGSGDDLLEPAGAGLLPQGAAKADGRSYFEQFLYRIDESAGTYDSGEPRATFMAASWDDRVYLENEDGVNVWGDVELWMLEDGAAYFVYAEWQQRSSSESWQTAERIVRTTWSEADDVLTIAGVGTGVAVDTEDGPGIEISFEQDLVSPGLTEQTIDVILVRTSSRLEHVERDYEEQEGR